MGLSYASVDQNAIRQVVDALPPALRALAGSADIATPTGYAGSAYLHPVALAVQAAVAISMAAAPGARGRGRDRRARALAPAAAAPAGSPPTRLAMVTGLVVVVAGGYLGGLVAALTVDDLAPVDPGPLALALLAGFALLPGRGRRDAARRLARAHRRARVGLGHRVPARSPTRSTTSARSGRSPSRSGPLSIFHYLDPPAVLGSGSLGGDDVLALLGLAAVTVAAALVLVERRDLTP